MELKGLCSRVNNPEYGNNVLVQETKLVSTEPNSVHHKFLRCLVSVAYEELFKVTIGFCFDNISLPLPDLLLCVHSVVHTSLDQTSCVSS
jgi:hypothetical protein